MAYFVIVGGAGTWMLMKVASCIDPPGSRWVNFSLKNYRRAHRHKQLYMLSWHIDERRLADSSEWRELQNDHAGMAAWCESAIRKHMKKEETDAQSEIDREFA